MEFADALRGERGGDRSPIRPPRYRPTSFQAPYPRIREGIRAHPPYAPLLVGRRGRRTPLTIQEAHPRRQYLFIYRFAEQGGGGGVVVGGERLSALTASAKWAPRILPNLIDSAMRRAVLWGYIIRRVFAYF